MENNIKNNTRTVGVSMTTHNTYFMKVEIDNKSQFMEEIKKII